MFRGNLILDVSLKAGLHVRRKSTRNIRKPEADDLRAHTHQVVDFGLFVLTKDNTCYKLLPRQRMSLGHLLASHLLTSH